MQSQTDSPNNYDRVTLHAVDSVILVDVIEFQIYR